MCWVRPVSEWHKHANGVAKVHATHWQSKRKSIWNSTTYAYKHKYFHLYTYTHINTNSIEVATIQRDFESRQHLPCLVNFICSRKKAQGNFMAKPYHNQYNMYICTCLPCFSPAALTYTHTHIHIHTFKHPCPARLLAIFRACAPCLLLESGKKIPLLLLCNLI